MRRSRVKQSALSALIAAGLLLGAVGAYAAGVAGSAPASPSAATVAETKDDGHGRAANGTGTGDVTDGTSNT